MHFAIKIKILAVYFTVFPLLLLGQTKDSSLDYQTKNIIWFTPNGVNKINGLAVGLQAINIDKGALSINGINTSAGIGGMVITPYAIFYSFPFRKGIYSDFSKDDDSTGTTIKGLSISMGGEIDLTVTGINISGGVTGGNSLKGISITGIYTKTRSFTGICISGLHNISLNGAGIQIGLFNYCENLKGLQIGLWNKTSRRSLPFINWGF
jgi:hypothetical protein